MQNDTIYTTKDVLKKVGITRPTLYKWLKEGKVSEVARDRNNFRLFTKEDIKRILAYKELIKLPRLCDISHRAGNSPSGGKKDA